MYNEHIEFYVLRALPNDGPVTYYNNLIVISQIKELGNAPKTSYESRNLWTYIYTET